MNTTTPQLTPTVRTFTQRLSSTRRGARLARLLAAEELRTWPVSPTVTERAEQIAESCRCSWTGKEIGERVARERERAVLSQRELAVRAELGQPTLARMERSPPV